jgi:chromate transporter
VTLVFTLQDWLTLFLHYLSLSLLSIGGAISTAPDLHRFLVEQQHWLTDAQFNASIAIAQAAPGPNVLFVAVLGWNVGLNAGGGMLTGLLGVVLALSGMLLPSSVLAYQTAQWGHRNRELRAVRAFKQGMAPIVVALMTATGWILATANSSNVDQAGSLLHNWPMWLLAGLATIIVWRSKIHLLYLLGAGALLGWFGLI